VEIFGLIDILEPVVAYNRALWQCAGAVPSRQRPVTPEGPVVKTGMALEFGVIPGLNQGEDNGDMPNIP